MSWTHIDDATPRPLQDVIVAHLDETGEYVWEIGFLGRDGVWRATYLGENEILDVHYWTEIPEVPEPYLQTHDPNT